MPAWKQKYDPETYKVEEKTGRGCTVSLSGL